MTTFNTQTTSSIYSDTVSNTSAIETFENPNYLITREQWKLVQAHWKKFANNKNIDKRATDYCLYTIFAGKDPLLAFTPISNKVKLENGCRRYESYESCLHGLRWLANISDKQHLIKFIARWGTADADEKLFFGMDTHEFSACLSKRIQELITEFEAKKIKPSNQS